MRDFWLSFPSMDNHHRILYKTIPAGLILFTHSIVGNILGFMTSVTVANPFTGCGLAAVSELMIVLDLIEKPPHFSSTGEVITLSILLFLKRGVRMALTIGAGTSTTSALGSSLSSAENHSSSSHRYQKCPEQPHRQSGTLRNSTAYSHARTARGLHRHITWTTSSSSHEWHGRRRTGAESVSTIQSSSTIRPPSSCGKCSSCQNFA